MQNAYLLGSFAKRVTLYSQQVRALNLIYALHKTNKFEKGSRVVVVGAGAAGLMAAAAAADLGADVTVLEQFQGPMELQRNSRIRWIDPFIYDWPVTENAGSRANLPFLDWESEYAEKVSEQIERKWNLLTEKWKGVEDPAPHKIACFWNIHKEKLIFSAFQGQTRVSCSGRYNGEDRGLAESFKVVILAVGFGIEPEHDAKYSYWSDDNLDGGFRKNRGGQEWLVSGCGDGGLTDLMRLCIHRFRHGRISDIFSGVKNFEAVKDLLEKAYKEQLPKQETRQDQEVFLTNLFTEIKNRYDLLPQYKDVQRRLNMPSVFLSGDGPSPYGPGSSTLNKLIVCQLERHAAFQYIPGRARIKQAFSQGGYLKRKVSFPDGGSRIFHRVIERHGTEKSIDAPCFAPFKGGLAKLEKRWEAVFVAGDQTRDKQWDLDYFVQTSPSAYIAPRERVFVNSMKEIGVRVLRLSVTKQLDNTGGSTLSYQFEGLSVLSGNLSKIRIVCASVTGIVDELKLDPEAERLGILWVPDAKDPVGTLEERITSMGRVSGYIEFRAPLAAGSSTTFGFSFRIFNGDALSKWEFYQMYGPKDRHHINCEDLGNEIEYLARIIWFPVDILKLKLILPTRVWTPPFLSMFRYDDADHIPRNVILDEEKVLHISPALDSPFHPASKDGKSSWSRVDDPLYVEGGMTTLVNTASQTWELTVSQPPIGSCYSLDWILDNPSPELDPFVEEAVRFRARLLWHREQRLDGKPGLPTIRNCFQELRKEIYEIFSPTAGDAFEVSIMTYDESKRVLVPIEGMVGEDEFSKALWNTAIPFGLGLAGSAFKESEMIFRVPEPPVLFPFYLVLPGQPIHQYLISASLDHPKLDHPDLQIADLEPVLDRSRQCLGVLNIGSFSSKSQLRMVPSLGESVAGVCQKFCGCLYDVLRDNGPL